MKDYWTTTKSRIIAKFITESVMKIKPNTKSNSYKIKANSYRF
jgi:hypothetical protein